MRIVVRNTKIKIKKIPSLVLLCLLILTWHVKVFAGSEIDIKDGLLSVAAQDLRLDFILRQVAEKTNIRIVFYGSTDQRITTQINSTPVEEALKQLLSNTAFSFLYRAGKNEKGDILPVLSEIIIIPEKSGGETVYYSAKTMPSAENEPPRIVSIPTIAPKNFKPSVDQPEEKQAYGRGVFVKLEPEMIKLIAVHELFSGSNSMPVKLDSGLSQRIEEPAGLFGLAISSVDEGSILGRMGLKNGDVIRQINAERVADAHMAGEKIKKILSDLGSGPIRIEVERNATVEPIYIELN
jgi:hypothetical protein